MQKEQDCAVATVRLFRSGSAGSDDPYGVGELLWPDVFEQEAAGAGAIGALVGRRHHSLSNSRA